MRASLFSLETLGIDDLAILAIGLYLRQVVHAVAADHNEVRAILVEGTRLKTAVVRVGYFEAGETPLAAKVVADALHEGQLRLLVLRSICIVRVIRTPLRYLLPIILPLNRRRLRLNIGHLHAARRVQLHLENMNGAVVARARQLLALHIEAYGVNIRLLRPPPHLLQRQSRLHRENPNNRALVTGRREQRALVVQGDGGEGAVVSGDLEGLVLLVHVDADVSLLRVRRSQHSVLGVGVQRHEALGIGARVDGVDEAQLLKIINIGTDLQYHDNSN